MTQEQRTVEVKVLRFNPFVEQEPHYEVYKIPFIEGSSVSNVLQQINEEHEGGLAHYLSCRRGVCAGCMVRVNGKAVLACTELVHGDMVIEPVKQDRVIKDLVVRGTKADDRTT